MADFLLGILTGAAIGLVLIAPMLWILRRWKRNGGERP